MQEDSIFKQPAVTTATLPPSLREAAGRGRGWGVSQQTRCQRSKPIDPHPRPLRANCARLDPPRARACGGREEDSMARSRPNQQPSLRAQRSNPWRSECSKRRMDGFVARAPRNDVETQFRDLAACFFCARYSFIPALQLEGAGNAGRPMRPIATCAKVANKCTRVSRSHRNHPAFPTQWFTDYTVLSPVLGLFGHRHP